MRRCPPRQIARQLAEPRAQLGVLVVSLIRHGLSPRSPAREVEEFASRVKSGAGASGRGGIGLGRESAVPALAVPETLRSLGRLAARDGIQPPFDLVGDRVRSTELPLLERGETVVAH